VKIDPEYDAPTAVTDRTVHLGCAALAEALGSKQG